MSFFDDWEDDFKLEEAYYMNELFHSCFDDDPDEEDDDDWW